MPNEWIKVSRQRLPFELYVTDGESRHMKKEKCPANESKWVGKGSHLNYMWQTVKVYHKRKESRCKHTNWVGYCSPLSQPIINAQWTKMGFWGQACVTFGPEKDSSKHTHSWLWNKLSLSYPQKRLPKTNAHLTVERVVAVPHADESVCTLLDQKKTSQSAHTHIHTHTPDCETNCHCPPCR